MNFSPSYLDICCSVKHILCITVICNLCSVLGVPNQGQRPQWLLLPPYSHHQCADGVQSCS